jgi:6-phosphogluconolactonase
MSEPEIVIEASADELAAKTAERLVGLLGAVLRNGTGAAHLAITGGSILEKVLAAVADRAASVEWSRVHVWWGDERYVPSDSDDRNDRPAVSLLFDRVDLDPAKLHRMPASDAGFGDPEAAADWYAAELAAAMPGGAEPAVPAFDAVLLGVGPDGHCASLFPGHPGTRVTDTSVIAVHDSPKPPPVRLSLTFPALDAAKEIWFVASGDGKADAVARALSGEFDRTEVPSSGPRGRNRTLWLLDRDAAAKLPAQP